MKFTDGFWQLRPGVDALYAQEARDLAAENGELTVWAPTRVITARGDTLNRPLLTVSLASPAEGVIRVRIEHHRGAAGTGRGFGFDGDPEHRAEAWLDDEGGVIDAGALRARVRRGAPWELSFEHDGGVYTTSGHRSIGSIGLAPDAAVVAEPVGSDGISRTGKAEAGNYIHAQLSLDVGELIYGLGERFGPLVKNGQTVDVWNSDGGTSSEQAYKSIPFYLSNRGYGVLVNDTGHVSFEVGSEAVEQVQFSVAGLCLKK